MFVDFEDSDGGHSDDVLSGLLKNVDTRHSGPQNPFGITTFLEQIGYVIDFFNCSSRAVFFLHDARP